MFRSFAVARWTVLDAPDERGGAERIRGDHRRASPERCAAEVRKRACQLEDQTGAAKGGNRHRNPALLRGRGGRDSRAETWPRFAPKDQVADWLDAYAKIMDLDIWTGAECAGSRYDEVEKEWRLSVVRAGGACDVRPKHRW